MSKKLQSVLNGCGCIFVLLVVAAVLFPVFNKAHEGSYHNYCLSNERQIGLGLMQYIQDNDDRLPNTADANNPHITWRNTIYPQIKSVSIYQCPDREDKSLAPDGFPRSYAANDSGVLPGGYVNKGRGVFAGPGSIPVSLTDIHDPHETIALCETFHTDRPDFNIDDPQIFPPSRQRLWAGHATGSNYLLADGHTHWMPPQATQNMWHRDKKIPLSANGAAVLAQTVKAFAN